MRMTTRMMMVMDRYILRDGVPPELRAKSMKRVGFLADSLLLLDEKFLTGFRRVTRVVVARSRQKKIGREFEIDLVGAKMKVG